MARVIFLAKLILFLFIGSCDKKQINTPLQADNLLAKIDNKVITVNDFIKRCEYVPRPAYCRGNTYVHKKIALNSLIAEKILSIEFDKYKYELTDSQRSMIQGQKEQAMRHLMLKKIGFEKVKIDSAELEYLMKLSKRQYDIDFIIIDKESVSKISDLNGLKNLNELENIIDINRDINNRKLTFYDDMAKQVKETLFYGHQTLDSIYGPFSIQNDQMIFLQIKGWITNPDITVKQKQETLEIVRQDYIESEALKIFGEYVASIMQGKIIDFDEDIFKSFSNKLKKIYLVERDKKEQAMENSIWEINQKAEVTSFDEIKELADQNILLLDGEQFTVRDILGMIKKHPLVFRNKRIKNSSFFKELQYALADLFRDMHITEKAYKIGLDKDPDIKYLEEKWSDNIKANTLQLTFSGTYNNKIALDKKMVAKIDSLQLAYSNSIEIDMDKFEKITLSSLDMSVMYLNQPYSKLEPEFPILTDDHVLDYGRMVTFD